ncbi:MAG: putative porin, partial [Flavobacteriaceae bacterium]|nr:putative porin [Flavobacteriaceae bacterium]
MKKLLLVIVIGFVALSASAQVLDIKKRSDVDTNPLNPDGSNRVLDGEKPPIDLYKIISADRDTTYVDTSLTIRRDYRFNYLREDTFELLPFSNVGQTYNRLGYDFKETQLLPQFGAQSRRFFYLDAEDISYYHVPTPLTELFFKTVFEQGQQVDAFFTLNTSEQFNFSIAYKAVRSLGKYQHIRTSNGNFRATTNYHTKNKRYNLRAHYTFQDMENQENGGLQESSIQLFTADDPEFDDRARLEVNFEDALNELKGIRLYLDHEYQLVKNVDSLRSSIVTVGNKLEHNNMSYRFTQDDPFDAFGPSFIASDLRDRTTYQNFNAEGYVRVNQSLLGKITGFARYSSYNYGYNSVLILDEQRINNRLKGSIVQVGGSYEKTYKGFELSGQGAINVAGDYEGNFISAAAGYELDEDNRVEASISAQSLAPNFNFQLYQSDYQNYNWQNNLANEKTQILQFDLRSKKLFDAQVSYTGIDDYTYFGVRENDSTPSPMQHNERVDYLKVKVGRDFQYGVFVLANTLMYQQVLSGDAVLNVPQLVTRNSLFYQDHWFKKALFLQTGVTFSYFSEYHMNDYDPVLAEFYVQNEQKLGGWPQFDLFFNAKVRQTRIYFKWEHFNQLFNSSNQHFTAPG